jgi:hypothetical protein
MAFIIDEVKTFSDILTAPTGELWAKRNTTDYGAGSADDATLHAVDTLTGDTLVNAPFNYVPNNWISNSPVSGLFYGYDEKWFERMHTIPASEDLGTILSTVQSRFWMHNAYRNAVKVLTDVTISGSGFQGTTIVRERLGTTLPIGLPVTFEALQGEGFTFNVPATGEAAIDMNFDFTFQDGTASPSFNLVGSRAVVFPFIPTKPVKEQIEFLTDVIEARDGTESRISTRPEARQEFNMKYLIDQQQPEQYASAQALIVGMSGVPLGVGMWHQARKVYGNVQAGDQTIFMDPTDLDFRVGGYGLLWKDWNDTEIVSIAQVNDGFSVDIVSPLEKSFDIQDSDVYFVPMQLCVAKDQPKIARYQNNVAEFDINWESTENTGTLADHTDLYPNTYNGSPVIDDHHLMSGSTVSESFMADFEDVSSETGPRKYLGRKAVPSASSSRSWEGESMDYAMALRKFFYWARGMQKTFWFPTNRHDLLIKPGTSISAASSDIRITDTGYATRIGANAPFNFIRVTLTNGDVYYRQIMSASNDLDAAEDTLALDSSLGVDALDTEVAQICFLFRARMGSDKTKLTHTGQGRVSTSMPIMGIKQ